MNPITQVRRLLRDTRLLMRYAQEDPLQGRPIFITGAQRSGTTWMAQVLSVPGTKLFNEPLVEYSLLWNRKLGKMVDERGITKTLENILFKSRINLRFQHRTNSFSHRSLHKLSPIRLHGLPNHRVIIKDPPAFVQLPFIDLNFDFDFVILRRHPAAYTASIRRLGWDVDYRLRVLRDSPFFDRFGFHDSYYLNKMNSLTSVEKIALMYSLIHVCIEETRKELRNSHCLVRYEDLCQAPLETFKGVFEALGIPLVNLDRQLHMHKGTSKSAQHRHDTNRDASYQLEKWKSELSEIEIDRIMEVWHSLHPDEYRNDPCS